MAKILTAVFLALLITGGATAADLTAPIERVVDTSWLEQQTLKWGFIGSFCAAQTLTGLTEGYHWTRHSNYGGEHVVTSGNYHAFETARRGAWVVTGWFGYGNWRDADLSATGKLRRLGTALVWGRNCMEWSYKAQRYGNPFDYSEAHNRAAMVWFGIRDGKVTDLYIGTGPFSGPLVDIAFLTAGFLLLK